MTDIGLGTSLKVGAVVGVTAIVGLSYWHYTSLLGDLIEAQAAKALAQEQVLNVSGIANRNAEAVARADADRRAAIDALEFVQSGIDPNTKTSRLAESAIDTATAAEDGAVAPLMEALRKSRFGGAK